MRVLISGTPYKIGRDAGHSYYAKYLGCLTSPRHADYPAAAYFVYGSVWAADNDCFIGFDPPAYMRMLQRYQNIPGCVFVTAPDVVANARATLERFVQWQPIIKAYDYPVAFVLQDGMGQYSMPWNAIDAVFIGGSTEFKLGQYAAGIVLEARSLGKWVHMGRVTTNRRMQYARMLGCNSVDGSSFSRFTKKYVKAQAKPLKSYNIPLWDGLLC